MKKKKNQFTRLFKVCRQEWSRHNPERKQCFNMVKFKNDNTPKWRCEICRQLVAQSECDCDHINPIANATPETLDEFFECMKKLYCGILGLQILCKNCHKLKTKSEVHDRMRQKLLIPISKYIYPTSVLDATPTNILKQMAKAVQDMSHTDEKKKKRAQRKFDALSEKYL